MPKLTQDAYQVLAERISASRAFLYFTDCIYELSEAGMYVVKGRAKRARGGGGRATSTSEYSKQAFIGGERFRLSSIYGGKTDLIFVFSPMTASADFAFLELPGSGLKKMPGLLKLFESSFGPFERFIEIHGAALAAEEQKIEEQRVSESYGPRWGMFA